MLKKIEEKDVKIIYQLFVGKVVDEIGFNRAMELMQESKKAVLENANK